MSLSHRPDRVGEEIRHELSELLTRGAVHDPGVGFITLTRVTVSPDLQVARVFYTSMGDEAARRETSKALERATPFFRRHLGGRLRLRRVPELEFRFDESIANQDRIEQILRDLHAEEQQRAAASDRDASSDGAADAGPEEQGPAYDSRSGGSKAQDPPYSDDEG